jgi:hypothetical protein
MKRRVIEAELNEYKFIIKEDKPEVGAYLFVYQNGVDIRDELQDDVEHCKRFALKHYNVPLDAWKEII